MRLAPGAGRSVLQFLAAAAVFGHCHCCHCHAGMVTRCWGLCYRGPLTSHISIGPGGTQQAAAPALRPYLPPAKGKIWGIFCHCQPPKFPSEALTVLVRGAVTRQAHISTLLSSVRRPGAQPLAMPPRPSSRRQHCGFSSADFITLEGKASLSAMFRRILWGNGWLSSLRCELLHPQALR